MTDYDTHVNPENLKPLTWDNKQFVDRVKNAVMTHDIPTSELPKIIDLTGGAIGKICDRMIEETMADPRKRERGSYAKVTVDGRMLVSNQITVGEETHVSISPKVYTQMNLINPQYSKSEYHAIDMHTHGVVDVPPSSQDFVSVLKDSEEYGGQAIIIVTPSVRFLIMRTNETPSRSAEAARSVIQQKTNKIKTEGEQELRNYINHMNQFGGASDEQINIHRNKINSQMQMKHALDICEENNLVMYTSTGDNVYRRDN